MTNVLLSCAGRRHYLATYFRVALEGTGKVVGTDMDLTAPALSVCDVARRVPRVDSTEYLDALEQVIREEKIDMVFSLNDLELEMLARHRDAIEKNTGALLYIPSVETMEICSDKWRTFCFAKKLGVLTPATFLDVGSVLAAISRKELSFPVIVKPRWGSGSIGLFRCCDAEELHAAFEACQVVISRSRLAQFGSKDAIIIQDLIEGFEYGIDVLFSKKERPFGYAVKRKLAMRAGETDKAITVDPEPFRDTVGKIQGYIQHRGNLDCDFLERDGQLYLLEMNPRFGGGYPFTHLSGANHVAMLIADFEDHALAPYRYGVDCAFAKYDMLVSVPVSAEGGI